MNRSVSKTLIVTRMLGLKSSIGDRKESVE